MLYHVFPFSLIATMDIILREHCDFWALLLIKSLSDKVFFIFASIPLCQFSPSWYLRYLLLPIAMMCLTLPGDRTAWYLF